MHVHIVKAEACGKIWLDPTIEEDYLYGFTKREVREIKSIVEEQIESLKSAWNEYFGQ
jgi:hypothetical protein